MLELILNRQHRLLVKLKEPSAPITISLEDYFNAYLGINLTNGRHFNQHTKGYVRLEGVNMVLVEYSPFKSSIPYLGSCSFEGIVEFTKCLNKAIRVNKDTKFHATL